MSLDGFLDDADPERLLLSNAADFDRVDSVRAEHDAILVGAATVRADDPRLLVRSADRRAARVAAGRPASPVKVVVTRSGELDPGSRFFTAGDGEKVVFCPAPVAAAVRARVGAAARVAASSDTVLLPDLLGDLAGRGVRRLLVEGGSEILTWFLTSGLVDALDVAVAPFFVGDDHAPRFVGPGRLPWSVSNPLALAQVEQLGDVAVLHYRVAGPVGRMGP